MFSSKQALLKLKPSSGTVHLGSGKKITSTICAREMGLDAGWEAGLRCRLATEEVDKGAILFTRKITVAQKRSKH